MLTNLEDACQNETFRTQHYDPSFNLRQHSNQDSSLEMTVFTEDACGRNFHHQSLTCNPTIRCDHLTTNSPQLHMVKLVHEPQSHLSINSEAHKCQNPRHHRGYTHHCHSIPIDSGSHAHQNCIHRNANQLAQPHMDAVLCRHGQRHAHRGAAHEHKCRDNVCRCRGHRHLH